MDSTPVETQFRKWSGERTPKGDATAVIALPGSGTVPLSSQRTRPTFVRIYSAHSGERVRGTARILDVRQQHDVLAELLRWVAELYLST